MLKKILTQGIRLKKRMLWVIAALLVLMSTALAQVVAAPAHAIAINSYGIPAPFLMSWTPIWFFSISGGIGASFLKIEEVDKNFHFVHFAKAFIGLTAGLALCLLVTDGAEPPEAIMSFYAFCASIGGAVLVQGFIYLASMRRNQAKIFSRITGINAEYEESEK